MYGGFNVVYRKGAENGGADALSRLTATLEQGENGFPVLCIHFDPVTHGLDQRETRGIEKVHEFAWGTGTEDATSVADLGRLYAMNKVERLLKEPPVAAAAADPGLAWLQALLVSATRPWDGPSCCALRSTRHPLPPPRTTTGSDRCCRRN